MKWEPLKNNKCPQCNGDFTKDLETYKDLHRDENIFKHKCGFKITETRFKELCQTLVGNKLPGEIADLSKCCGAYMINGGEQCENCGGPGF